MKKILFFAVVASVALAGCSNDEYVGNTDVTQIASVNDGSAIVFNSGTSAVTRGESSGSAAAGLLHNNFVVEGVKSNGTITNQIVVFDNYNVNWVDATSNATTSDVTGWEYVGQAKNAKSSVSAQTIKFWDYMSNQYDFIAYSLGGSNLSNITVSAIDASKMNGVDSDNDNVIDQGAYSLTGTADELAKAYIADMMTAYNPDDYNKLVKFKFRSLASKVRVALYETVPGYSVKNVVFYSAAGTKATDGAAYLYTTGSDAFNAKGTYTVYFPTTGSTNKNDADYNKAHVFFTPDATDGTTAVKTFGALDYTNKGADEELAEAAGKIYLGRTSNAATFAGVSTNNYYSVVTPNETGAVLNLKVDYTLVSTDGSGEVINVTGASAQVPAVYGSWKPGYAYTYIFKISQNTNGQTGTGTTPAGLYPITFDAVVLETEDGIQETITTVSSTTITTYSKGKVVTEKDEYKTGANIYAVVGNGATKPTVGTDVNLYTAELKDGDTTDGITTAAQTINEASVANAIAHGTHDTTNKTYTVRDANKFDLVVKEASGLTAFDEIPATDAPNGKVMSVKGAYFNPSTAGTYVFEYISGTNKYYKIINVK